MRNPHEIFYPRGARLSFHTTKTPSGHQRSRNLALQRALTWVSPMRYAALERPWLGQQMQFDRLKRREFITLVASTAMTSPRTLVAQGFGKRRIGVLMELAADEPQARSNVAALQ